MDVKVYIFTHDDDKNRRKKLNNPIVQINNDLLKDNKNDDFEKLYKQLFKIFDSTNLTVDELCVLLNEHRNRASQKSNNNDESKYYVKKTSDIDKVSLYANYVVDLFSYFKDKNGITFNCPEIKIHKMILILQIAQAYNYIDFFNLNYQIEICPCGFKIPNLAIHTEKFVNNDCSDIKVDFAFDEKYLYIENSGCFNNSLITKENKKKLFVLFKNFANSNPVMLGQFLDTIKTDAMKEEIGKKISSKDFEKLATDGKEKVKNFNGLNVFSFFKELESTK